MPGFDPDRLTPVASLNRVRIADLPGLPPGDPARGRTANELLSAQALAARVHESAGALGLPDDVVDHRELLPMLDGCFDSRDPAVRGAAEQVAVWYGRNLSLLLLTLRRGDEANRRARPEWTDAHWAHWAGVRRVWLGGGLVSGRLGARAVLHARERLAGAGLNDLSLRLAMAPAELALIGIARSVPAGGESAGAPALVLDFGQSRVKRALAVYEGPLLAALHLLPSLPVPQWTGITSDTEGRAGQMLEFMAGVLADTWREVEAGRAVTATVRLMRLNPLLVTSVASYVVDGQPAVYGYGYERGAHAPLRLLPARAGELLARQLGERVGAPVRVELVHDGSAAARSYAGARQAAVIMLGSALGIGFPPEAGGVRPFAAHFAVRALAAGSGAAGAEGTVTGMGSGSGSVG